MTWKRVLGRALVALTSFAVVTVGLVVAAAAIALSIDWDIPEERALIGPSSVFDRNGTALARFVAEVEHREVPLEGISPHLRDAVVATEDHRFFEHRGVDPVAVLRAVWNNVRHGGIAEGGSTLTQQYVKNVYVGAERSFFRKIREAIVAIQLEKERGKDDILLAYLNRVYFGEGAYGAEAAALTYFSKPASELTLSESALLASVLSKPSDYSPRQDPEGALRRRDQVLGEMAEYGFRSSAEVQAAMAEPLALNAYVPPQPGAPYFVEEVRRQALDAYGPDLVYRGGLALSTTIDLNRQAELERRMAAHLPADPGFEPAVAVVDPRTGDVLAAWSGRDFVASQVDLALHPDYGRPSGSTFKVFALATALEEGYGLGSRFPAPAQASIGGWQPRGGGCGGSCTLLQAITASVNTAFANIGYEVGVPDFTTMARRLGVRSTMRDDDLTQVLGTASVTPLDMASAFGTLANDGVVCPARVISSVTDHLGNALPPPDPRQPSPEELAAWQARMAEQGWSPPAQDPGRCHRAVPTTVARRTTEALAQAVASGTGRRAQIGRPQAGKTGTTSDHTQAWFVGYTPDIAIAVMVSHRDGDVPLRDLPGCGAGCYGGELPARIWADVATGLLDGVPPTPFLEADEAAERVTAEGRQVVPRDAGAAGAGGGAGARPPRPAAAPPPAAAATPEPEGDADVDPPPDPNPAYTPTPPPQPPPPPPPEDGGLLGELLPDGP